MTLAEFLRSPCVDENCGLFVARWLTLAELADAIAALDPARARACAREGGTLSYAVETFADLGLAETEAPRPGDPLCVETSAGETMAICVSDRWRATVAQGPRVLFGRWPILRAWSAV